jgi:hypothetical protein
MPVEAGMFLTSMDGPGAVKTGSPISALSEACSLELVVEPAELVELDVAPEFEEPHAESSMPTAKTAPIDSIAVGRRPFAVA